MTGMKVTLVRRRLQATARRRRFPPAYSVLGLLCIVLLSATTVLARICQIGNDNEWCDEGGMAGSRACHSMQKPLGGEKDLHEPRLNRVAIIGKSIRQVA